MESKKQNKKEVKIQLKDVVNITFNSANKQISLNLQKRNMEKLGINQNQVLNFYLKKTKRKNDKN